MSVPCHDGIEALAAERREDALLEMVKGLPTHGCVRITRLAESRTPALGFTGAAAAAFLVEAVGISALARRESSIALAKRTKQSDRLVDLVIG